MAMDVNAPAFCRFVQFGDRAVQEGGLTIRQYFAAHAPRRPARWFQPAIPPPPPRVPPAPSRKAVVGGFPEFLTSALDSALESIRVGDSAAADAASWLRHADRWPSVFPLDADHEALLAQYESDCAAWRAQRRDALDAQTAWSAAREQQRIAQWPWAWADLVLGATVEREQFLDFARLVIAVNEESDLGILGAAVDRLAAAAQALLVATPPASDTSTERS